MVPGLAPIVVVDYWKSHNGFHIFDARASYKLSPVHKLSLVCNNVFNTAYYLRPLKIEPPRNVAIQYNYTF
jgi:outer membrane receptor for ferric coprogen and ferric-rhodotorulic acid